MWNKNYEVNKQLIAAFDNFRTAYNELDNLIANNDVNIMALDSFFDYPFEDEFDGYRSKIGYWCASSARELEETNSQLDNMFQLVKKQIVRVETSNQGGGCVVTIIKFVLNGCPQWMYLNEDSYLVVSHDYLNDPDWYDLELYDADECIIHSYQAADGNWDADDTPDYKYIAMYVRLGIDK